MKSFKDFGGLIRHLQSSSVRARPDHHDPCGGGPGVPLFHDHLAPHDEEDDNRWYEFWEHAVRMQCYDFLPMPTRSTSVLGIIEANGAGKAGFERVHGHIKPSTTTKKMQKLIKDLNPTRPRKGATSSLALSTNIGSRCKWSMHARKVSASHDIITG